MADIPSSIDIVQRSGYDEWVMPGDGPVVVDLEDGDRIENVLVDQRSSGASLTIRSRNAADWVVRNVGFRGIGKVGGGSTRFHFQVSCPGGATGLIENVWMSAKSASVDSDLGGMIIRGSHAGHIDIRHTYIEGMGNNAVYASGVGKGDNSNGSVGHENCYHRDNTVSQYRIGSPGSYVRNCVGIVDDPEGLRGSYIFGSTMHARGVWAKHWPDQRVENSSFYISPDDIQPGSALEARYISGNPPSNGPEAVLEAVNCEVNEDAPSVSSVTGGSSGDASKARVNITNLGRSPTVNVIGGGGVPLSPEMAALGQRAMPQEIPAIPHPPGNGNGGNGNENGENGGNGTNGNGEAALGPRLVAYAVIGGLAHEVYRRKKERGG